jgi:MFS family permease
LIDSRATFDGDLKGVWRWYAVAIMGLVSASQFADKQILTIVMEPLKKEFHFSDTQLGVLSGTSFGVAYALGAVPLAIVADRLGRKRTIAATLAVWSVATAFTAVASNYLSLLLTRTLVGTAESGAGPAMLALLSRWFAPEKRGGMVGLLTMLTAIAGSLVYLGSGFLVDRFGWRPLFLIFGVPGIVLAILIACTISEGRPDHEASKVRLTGRQVIRALTRPAMLQLTAAQLWIGVIVTGTQSWMPPFLMRSFSMSLTVAGFWLALGGICTGVIGAFAGGFIANALEARREAGALVFALVMLSANLLASLVLFLVSSAPVALGFMVLSSLFVGLFSPAMISQLLNFMPQESRATLMAIVSMIVFLLSGLGSAAVGFLSDQFTMLGYANGLRTALLCQSALGIFPVIHLFFLVRGARTSRARSISRSAANSEAPSEQFSPL